MNEEIFFYFIAHILIALTSFFLSIFVLAKSRKKINVLFFLFSLAVSLWAVFYAIWVASDNQQYALFFARTLNLFAIFIPVFYFHWLMCFLEKKAHKRIILVYTLTAIFAISGYSDIFVSSVKNIEPFPYFPQSNWLHILFLVEWTIIVLYGVALLISAIKRSSNKKRKQLIAVLIGTTVGFIGGSFNFLFMLNIDILPPLASLLVIVFPIMSGYAMVEYNLMNTEVIFAQVLLIILNISAIALIFTSDTTTEYIAKIIFAILIMGVSYLLRKNYEREIKQKEKLFKLSKDLERANAELKRLDKAKSEFISIASHQLRTPLTAIKGYISLILEGAYGKNTPETDSALNKIFLANEHLIQLVEDLLNITHIESGRLKYHIGDVYLEEILEELYDMFTLRAQDKKLDFVLDLPDGKLPVLQADKSKLREVISNLIDNAIKYTNKGFVHVSVEYDKRAVRIIVEDSGVGVSPESMKTLFAKFSRGTDSSKIYTEGTGLGLFVGKNLIESQGGHIYAESDGVGKGSKFVIEMPINNVKK